MANKDQEEKGVESNSAHDIVKKESSVRDYPNLLDLQMKNSIPKFGES